MIKPFRNEPDLIAALRQGEVSAIVIGMLSTDFLQKKYSNIWPLKVALDKPYGYGVGIAISKSRKKLVKKIAEIIHDLKDEGMITMLQLKWFGKTF